MQTQIIKNQVKLDREIYNANRIPRDEIAYGDEEKILDLAEKILERRVRHSDPLTSPVASKKYVSVLTRNHTVEVFGAIWLDTRHRVIEIEDLFTGTIDSASVYPREIVKRALTTNAAAAVFYHNHPSGEAVPSSSDIQITKNIKQALQTIKVTVLDHLIAGRGETYSMAENWQI